MAFELPKLEYSYEALEPYIDARTMDIHYNNHHGAYVKNLNSALEGHSDLQKKSIEDILLNLGTVPEAVRTAVRNNGGGHYNHTLFWTIMGPTKSSAPKGDLSKDLTKVFGSLENFKAEWKKAALSRFGSGWVWLLVDGTGKLAITSTPNQDSPLIDGNRRLILGLDVWEHAYYLKYQYRRADYVDAWWNVVNWDAVTDRYNKFNR